MTETKRPTTDKPGIVGTVTVYKVRCPECRLLGEYDGSVLFSPEEFDDLPDTLECEDPVCGAVFTTPRRPERTV